MEYKYAISLDGINYNEPYNTYQEALDEGLKFHDGDFYIAKCYEFDPRVDLAYHAIDQVIDKAEEDCGEDAGDFLWRLTDKDYKELDDKLNDVLVKFANDHRDMILYTIDDTVSIVRED